MSGPEPLPMVLRRMRGERSQADMAAKYGRTQAWWSRIENGKRHPSVADLEALSIFGGLCLNAGLWSAAAGKEPT